MTLNKWILAVALLFSSAEALARLDNKLASSPLGAQQVMFYGNTLAEQYPDQNLVLKVNHYLSAEEVAQIFNELSTFERVMNGDLDKSVLRDFQLVGCVACGGGGGGGCPRNVCYKSNRGSAKP